MRHPGFASLLVAALVSLLSHHALAQSVTLSNTKDVTFIRGTKTQPALDGTAEPTGPYISFPNRITLTAASGNVTKTVVEIEGPNHITITGTITIPSNNVTGANVTVTKTASQPKNTQPCNGYVEFCSRPYSNITMVGSHNSPFVRPGSSASNQQLPVKQQLDDGVRFLQAQIQFPANSGVPHFCHTQCALFDAGPITDWLGEVKDWVDDHPYDVLTILLGNGNFSAPSVYAPFIEQTGILKYTYEPPVLPMSLNDWPTLESMILRGKRVVMFMDYEANQLEFPWLLDEFSQMWETPFDPLNRAFPCNVDRPPNLSKDASVDRLYIMNHNLNANFEIFGTQLLVPDVSVLNQTNAVAGFGSAGVAVNNCRSDWGRAPTVLNVDYYNIGNVNGSIFEVAARANNVTYNGKCCGLVSDAATLNAFPVLLILVGVAMLSTMWAL